MARSSAFGVADDTERAKARGKRADNQNAVLFHTVDFQKLEIFV